MRPGTVLATGAPTRSSVTRLAADSARPAERVLGLHFFNPAPAMKLSVEVSLQRADRADRRRRRHRSRDRAGQGARRGRRPARIRRRTSLLSATEPAAARTREAKHASRARTSTPR
ncbi:3-hydroxyacyl-CoA dehydrogenase NAD-binding domain-containing protein [Streptomyces sp. KL116D]|uniref:3-hydroxyacyl-CoA dehydrogenase NAD-binding domain-containing protein n=1 Tax=Streptomyces sp. KL116D TaxID=3045152 RepID=UPI003556566B